MRAWGLEPPGRTAPAARRSSSAWAGTYPRSEVMRGESVVEGHSADFAGDVTGNLFTSDRRNAVGFHGVVRVARSPAKLELRDHQRGAGRPALQLRDRGHVGDRQPHAWRRRPRRGPLGEPAPSRLPPRRPRPCPPSSSARPPTLLRWSTGLPPNTSNGSQSGFPRFTSTKARRAVKKALAHRYGKAFSCARGLRGGMREEELFPLELRSPMGLRPVRVQGQGRAHQALRWARCDPALAAQDEVDLSGAQAHGRRCTERC